MASTGYLAAGQKFNLNNRAGKLAHTVQMGTLLDESYRVARFTVAASDLTDGSAVLFGTAIPDNAVITKVWIDVTTTFAGDVDDSSTIKIGLEDQDNDVVVAVAISDVSNPWDAGIQAGVQVGTAATMIKLTAARQLAVTWTSNADAALSAGSMEVFVEWAQST